MRKHNPRQAIITKYFGPSASGRGSRIKATYAGGSVFMEYLHNYDLEDNHRLAAEKLVKKLGWRGDWYMGGIPNGGYAHVDVSK